ncbi:MAG: sugar phosphate isomerase/epimerase family protein [Armatimonadota bacterium]|nr:sugar phosphate isomerase/epimerase family protein [Armatimonadota bacterium]
MNESMYKYMDVGLIHFMAYPQTIKGEGPILETLAEIAADDYFTLVEITWMKDPEVRQKAKELLAHSGMSVAYGAQPALLTQKLNLNAEDPAERLKAIDQIKACIDEAYEMSVRGLAVLSGKDPGAAGRAKAKELLIDSLKQLCKYSASKGKMPIALETFDRVEYGKNALIGPTSEAVEVAKAVKAECANFGLMLDLSHIPLLGETAKECLTTAKDHIAHIHIGNCVMRDSAHPAYGDEHPRFGIPGGENGVAELAEFLKVLLEIGYLDGKTPKPVSFEVKPIAAIGETTAAVVANAKRALNQAWARV